MGGKKITVHATEGSFAWIEATPERSSGLSESLVRIVEAAYATWGEENWIVRRAFCGKFPREKYLRELGVPYSRAGLERKILWTIPARRKMLSLVFEDAASCIASLESDYPDERLLVLQAYPRTLYGTGEEALREKVDDISWFDLRPVAEGTASAAVVYDPLEGTGRVFAGDDSVVRFAAYIAGTPRA